MRGHASCACFEDGRNVAASGPPAVNAAPLPFAGALFPAVCQGDYQAWGPNLQTRGSTAEPRARPPLQAAAISRDRPDHARKRGNKFPSPSSRHAAVARALTPPMFQRTSITERLHPAVQAVKTPSFFQKYFHSAVIASICGDGKPSRCSRATRWRDGAVKKTSVSLHPLLLS